MNILSFEIGDNIRFIKKFYNQSPHEDWETAFGCPPLDIGTTGIVKKIKHNRLIVEVINPMSQKPVNILIYNDDAQDAEESQKLHCIEKIL